MKSRIFFPVIMAILSLCWLGEVWAAKPPPIPRGVPQKSELKLYPPTWEKSKRKEPIQSGKLLYYDNSPGTLKGEIKLSRLRPNQLYALILQGKREHPSSRYLPQTLKGYRGEEKKYFEFKRVHTDKRGYLKTNFEVNLPAGVYDVKFFVRYGGDGSLVLYNDFFLFTVR